MRQSFDVGGAADDRNRTKSSNPTRETFGRTWTTAGGFGNLARGITEGWQKNFDSEDAWTRRLMEEVSTRQKKGVVGDIPGECLLKI